MNNGFLDSSNGRGTPSREIEEEHGHTKNGAARRKPERIRSVTPNGADGAAIPDYVMRNFDFFEEAGEDRVRGRE